MPAAKKKVTEILNHTKDHKHTVRYDSEDSDVLGNAYVSKEALDKLGNPKSIKVTIEAA